MRILVVDDVPEIRRLVRRFLEPEGHILMECANGAEALKVLERHPFDLVITDMNMPDLDGIQLTRALRRQAGAPRILAISGAGGESLLQTAEILGAAATISKPFTRDELIAVVRVATRNPETGDDRQ